MGAEVLEFSRSLYREEAVRAAVAAYAALGSFTVEPTDHSLRVTIAEGRLGSLPDHFSNHVLFETVRLSRVSP